MSPAVDKSQKAISELRNAILNGEFPSGRFPSIAAIMSRFGLARATAVRVRDELKNQRLIVGRTGKGTFITKKAVSRKIGLIVPSIIGSEFFPVVVSEVAKVVRENGYTLQFADFQGGAYSPCLIDEMMAFVESLVQDGVCGVLFEPLEFLPNAGEWNRRVLECLERAQIPVVLLVNEFDNGSLRSRYDMVAIDNALAGRRIAEHLLAVGARRIMFVTRPHSGTAFMGRRRGIESVVLERGGRFSTLEIEPGDVAALKRHLKRGCPDAFVCGSDTQAGIFAKSLKAVGFSVPEDVLLAGINDLQIARIMSPSLTTIHQPCRDLARMAFDTLMLRIDHPEKPFEARFLDAPLVVRESTQGDRVAQSLNKRKKTK